MPPTMRKFIESQIVIDKYGTASEYIRDLIRRDQHRLRIEYQEHKERMQYRRQDNLDHIYRP